MALKLDYEVTVKKPIEEVWEYSNNPDNLIHWLNDFVRYEQLAGDRANPKVGDTTNHVYRLVLMAKTAFGYRASSTAVTPTR